MATIARGGIMVSPTFLREPVGEQVSERISSVKNTRIIQEGMQQVVYDPRGTGYGAFHPLDWPRETVELHGKTGSTYYSLFGGFARVRATGECLAYAVVLEVDAHGSEAAAPLTREIIRICARQGFLPEPIQENH
jgi:cell division protein FtsI/penicillin-binding protein 2